MSMRLEDLVEDLRVEVIGFASKISPMDGNRLEMLIC
jgi:hypothetical protein